MLSSLDYVMKCHSRLAQLINDTFANNFITGGKDCDVARENTSRVASSMARNISSICVIFIYLRSTIINYKNMYIYIYMLCVFYMYIHYTYYYLYVYIYIILYLYLYLIYSYIYIYIYIYIFIFICEHTIYMYMYT
jgi:hypothetical protein